MLFAEIVATSDAVRDASGRNDKRALLADALRRLPPQEVGGGRRVPLRRPAASARSASAGRRCASRRPPPSRPLTVAEVDAAFARDRRDGRPRVASPPGATRSARCSRARRSDEQRFLRGAARATSARARWRA